jgi:hypothetical protein
LQLHVPWRQQSAQQLQRHRQEGCAVAENHLQEVPQQVLLLCCCLQVKMQEIPHLDLLRTSTCCCLQLLLWHLQHVLPLVCCCGKQVHRG